MAVQLQQSDLRLQDALWMAKASGSGSSVSLFWPSPMSSGSVSNPPKKRRRRRKKKVKVAKDGGVRGRKLRDKAGRVPTGAHHVIEECVVSEEATGEEKPSEDCREDEAVDEVGVMQTQMILKAVTKRLVVGV